MRRFRWDKKYLYWGVTAFCVVAAAILFYMLVNHMEGLRDALGYLAAIVSPFLWGLAIAYLLYPLVKVYQRFLFQPAAKWLYRKRDQGAAAAAKLARGLAVFLAIITLLLLVVGMVMMVAPQLYSSIESLVVNSEKYIAVADAWIARFFTDYPEAEAAISGLVGDISNGLATWAANSLLPELKSLISNVTSSMYSFAKGVYNVIIGIIVSVYVLFNRESVCAHCKRIVYAIFSLEAAEKILEGVHFANRVFMGFLSGKVLDSLIIGVMCYIGCALMRIEYAMLVSVIVGITNIIPFFGPLFGMIPSAFFILTESPVHALVFVIFVVLLQQFDGNFLGPKILGNSVGVNGFWILFSILLGGGLFGFIGMLLGVPVFVVIYTFLARMVDKKLRRSELPVDVEVYMDMDHIDPKSGQPVKFDQTQKRSAGRKKKPLRRRKKEETATAVSSEEASEQVRETVQR